MKGGEKEMNPDMEQFCSDTREVIQKVAVPVKDRMNDPVFFQKELFPGQHSEMKANLMLAYRHLEDGRMRLGKVMQQIQGGVSIFDRDDNESRPETPQPKGE